MQKKIYFAAFIVLSVLWACNQEPAPVIYKDETSYISKSDVRSKNIGRIYIDYNGNEHHENQTENNPYSKKNEHIFSESVKKAPPVPVSSKNVDTIIVENDVIIESDIDNQNDNALNKDTIKKPIKKEKFLMPLKGGYFNKQSDADRLSGKIYIMSPSDGNVMAIADGKVVYLGNRKNGDKLKTYNNLIIIEHSNNFMSIYADLDKIYTSNNKNVKKGEVIGAVVKKHGRDYELNFSMRANKIDTVNPKDLLQNK